MAEVTDRDREAAAEFISGPAANIMFDSRKDAVELMATLIAQAIMSEKMP